MGRQRRRWSAERRGTLLTQLSITTNGSTGLSGMLTGGMNGTASYLFPTSTALGIAVHSAPAARSAFTSH